MTYPHSYQQVINIVIHNYVKNKKVINNFMLITFILVDNYIDNLIDLGFTCFPV
nr:MAG TPA: hypothetical protein [Caudoviricetes sp.]